MKRSLSCRTWLDKFTLAFFALILTSAVTDTNLYAQAFFVKVVVQRIPTDVKDFIPFQGYTNKDSIFQIVPQELKSLDLDSIPVCVTMTFGQEIDNQSALTDANGVARFSHFPVCMSCSQIVANADGKCDGTAMQRKPEFDAYTGRLDAMRSVWNRGDTVYVRLVHDDWLLIKARAAVLELANRLGALDYISAVTRIDSAVGRNSALHEYYPKSCHVMRAKLLQVLEESKQEMADRAFAQDRYSDALPLYDSLLANFPDSPFTSANTQKKNSCLTFLRTKFVCDSLVNAGSSISNQPKALAFFRQILAKVAPTDPCYPTIQTKISGLESDIEQEKEQAAYHRLKVEDENAIKRFRVDRTVTQIDLFKNPFAFKGQCILMTCVVYKFETPTSAIMDGGQRFYARFKVTPPKKFSELYLIVRVEGVTTLLNAFGTPIKVPLVDVVHILNLPPDNNSGDN